MFDTYEKFKKDVLKLTKIDLNFYKEKQMKRRIDTLATKNKATNYDEYIKMISTDKEKFEQFVNFLTINVSEFYRNPDQWNLMDKNVIPKIVKEQRKPIKIWSAACSTGDEPYSLAIVITTCFESLLSVFVVVSLFVTFTFPCFNFLISLIKNIVANMNANPSANGPANKTPCIPNIFPKTIIAGIKKAICLDIESIALIMLFPIAWKNIPDGIWIPLQMQSIKYVLNAKHANSI